MQKQAFIIADKNWLKHEWYIFFSYLLFLLLLIAYMAI